MKRSTFFKSLIAVIAAPKILSEIKWAKPKITKLVGPSPTLYKDLQYIEPAYYKEYVEMYGSENFTWWLDEMGKYDFITEKGPVIKMSDRPVTITIRKDNHVS